MSVLKPGRAAAPPLLASTLHLVLPGLAGEGSPSTAAGEGNPSTAWLLVLSLPQVAELLAGVPAPVVYWEQGHEWLFGDPVRLQVGGVFTCRLTP